MDTRQLKFFVACAKAGSISEAARKLYSTQSTVKGNQKHGGNNGNPAV